MGDEYSGVVVGVDFGYGLKYGDEDELYLCLLIQLCDGYMCNQYYHIDNVPKVLEHFRRKKVGDLLHTLVVADRISDDHTRNPSRIRNRYQKEWLVNDNNRKTFKIRWKDDCSSDMVNYSVGNICKAVQRIRSDILSNDYVSAIARCDSLEDLLCEIEDGKCSLEVESKVHRVTY